MIIIRVVIMIVLRCWPLAGGGSTAASWQPRRASAIKIHQRGVQRKQGVVAYIILQAVLLCNATPIHCTPLRLHPPLMDTQATSPKTAWPG